MIFLILLLLELISLYVLSILFIRALAQLFYRFSQNRQILVVIYTLLFLPGTIIHELAHLLTAMLLMVPVGEIHILPEVVENKIHMGTVSTAETDVFRRTLVGLAPFIVGTSIIFYCLTLERTWLIYYLIFEMSNTMFSSSEDLKESWGLFVAILLLFCLAGFGLFYFKIGLDLTGLFQLSEKAITIMANPLVINFFAFLIVRTLCYIGANGRKF